MYNSLNSPRKIGEFTHSAETRQKIRETTLANRKRDVRNSVSYPCICHGVWYRRIQDASYAYGYKSKDGIKSKLKNPNELDFISLKPPVTKPFPNDPILRRQIEAFYKGLERLPYGFTDIDEK
jgi:hypothetical protein